MIATFISDGEIHAIINLSTINFIKWSKNNLEKGYTIEFYSGITRVTALEFIEFSKIMSIMEQIATIMRDNRPTFNINIEP